MLATIEFEHKSVGIDLSEPLEISIPVGFEGKQFQAFGAPSATSEPYTVGDSSLSVQDGAGCNCPLFHFAAHLHGTHTECVGHISEQNITLQDVVPEKAFHLAKLITVEPVLATECQESYYPNLEDQDKVLTRRTLETILGSMDSVPEALVIRTMPNDDSKLIRNYSEMPAPYFTNEAMIFLVELGIQFLLVDLPSVDRSEDQGKLSNHHIYWNVEQDKNSVTVPSPKAITEFIYVPDSIKDGAYLLSLNIANIRSDAAPSRPLLYEIREL